MKEHEVVGRFLALLQGRLGYPDDSLLHEFPLRGSNGVLVRLADLIIQDPAGSRLLAAVEFKGDYAIDIVERAFKNTAEYLEMLGQPLPEYVVVGAEGPEQKIRIFTKGTDGKPIELDPGKFPSFHALRSGQRGIESLRIEVERKRKIDEVRVVCFSSSAVLFIILVLSLSGIYTPTPMQLGIIAGIIGMLLLPNASKLKGLGIEFERLKRENERNV